MAQRAKAAKLSQRREQNEAGNQRRQGSGS